MSSSPLVLFVFAGASLKYGAVASMDDTQDPLIDRLAAVNLFLALFNMIPAFPMDGGRVLRALLATQARLRARDRDRGLDRQGTAFLLGFIGLFYNPILIFIAIFVYLAASSEAHMVALRAVSRGVPVSAATMTQIATLTPEAHIDEAVQTLLRTSQNEFPVVDAAGKPVGVARTLRHHPRAQELGPDARVREAMNATLPMIDKRRPLEEALKLLQDKSAPAVAVIESDGRLVGLITAETLGELMMVREAMPDGMRAGPKDGPRTALGAGRRERDSMHEPGQKLMRKHRLRTLLGAKTAAREVANRYPVEEDFEHRIRVMLRYRWLVLVSATLLIIGLSAASFYFLSQPARLRIAVGPAGSDDLRLIQFLADKIREGPRAGPAADHRHGEFGAKRRHARKRLRRSRGRAPRSGLPEKRTGGRGPAQELRRAVRAGRTARRRDPGQNQETKAGAHREDRGSRGKTHRRGRTFASQCRIAESDPRAIRQFRSTRFRSSTCPQPTSRTAIRTEKPDAILTIGPLRQQDHNGRASTATVAITPNRKPPIFLPIGSSEAIAERFPAYESSRNRQRRVRRLAVAAGRKTSRP